MGDNRFPEKVGITKGHKRLADEILKSKFGKTCFKDINELYSFIFVDWHMRNVGLNLKKKNGKS